MAIRLRLSIGETPAQIAQAVLGLARISRVQMDESRGRLPRLYGGRVRYKREPSHRERWQTAEETAALGHGDCEDLAAYRLAELWRQGERGANVVVRTVRPGLMHILVRRENGSLEDPSKRLGMRGKG